MVLLPVLAGGAGLVLGGVSGRVVDRWARPPRRRVWRDAALAVTTAVLFVGVSARLDVVGRVAALPAYLYLTVAGVVLAAIDLSVHRLPDRLVLPSYLVLAALLALASVWSADGAALLRAAEGAALLVAVYLALALAHPAGLGLGDVKLVGVLGAGTAYLSWSTLLVATCVAWLAVGVAGAVVLVTRRGGWGSELPYGPFLLGGTALAVVAADPLVTAYVGLVGVR